jgi:hypothetical protein
LEHAIGFHIGCEFFCLDFLPNEEIYFFDGTPETSVNQTIVCGANRRRAYPGKPDCHRTATKTAFCVTSRQAFRKTAHIFFKPALVVTHVHTPEFAE